MTVYPFIGFAEPFSALSHFAGALVCAVSSYSLLRADKQGSRRNKIALALFCFGCVFLLTMSGVFHLLPRGSSAGLVLQRLDHAAIFVLIAGTFTPIHIIKFQGFWRWAPLTVVWTMAVIGIVLKSIFFTEIPELASLATYLAMGWFGILTAVLLWLESGFALVRPLVSGAIVYSVGAVAEFVRSPVIIYGVIGPHELFHIAVLIGIAYHWQLIQQLVVAPSVVASSVVE